MDATLHRVMHPIASARRQARLTVSRNAAAVFTAPDQLTHTFTMFFKKVLKSVATITGHNTEAAYGFVYLQGGGFKTISYVGYIFGLYHIGAIRSHTIFTGASMGAFWELWATVLTGDVSVMAYK
jgi:hypothetical protein